MPRRRHERKTIVVKVLIARETKLPELPGLLGVSWFSIKTIHVNEAKKIMTVVFSDGAKQIVKCSPEDSFDAEIGFALALARKLFGSKTQVRKYIDRNAKVIKSPVIDKPKRGRKPRKVVEQSQKEEN